MYCSSRWLGLFGMAAGLWGAWGCAGAAQPADQPQQAENVAVVDLGKAAPQADVSPPKPVATAPAKPSDTDDAERAGESGAEKPDEASDERPVGMIGLLNAGALAPIDMSGAMQGSGFGSGASGLGLRGTGSTGGSGTGVGSLGTLGRGGGLGARNASPGVLRAEAPAAVGKLDPEIIRRVVRARFAKFRACYEKGLTANPSLQGKVTVRFVIGQDGAVVSAANDGSTLSDKNVVQCVVNAFQEISFPKPENGVVVVKYPIVFSPGDGAGNTASPKAAPSAGPAAAPKGNPPSSP